MERDYLAIYSQYAESVKDGNIQACRQVLQMVQRQEKDLDRQEIDDSFPYVWKPEIYSLLVCNFLERFKHFKGKWAGQQFILEPWQVYLTAVLFGWVHPKTNLRRFREFFLLVPRKNGKTTYAAGLGLFGLIADMEPGAEIYCGANGKDQANILFTTAKNMLQSNIEIKERSGAEILASNISILKTASKFEPEIKNVRDGASPHFAICDELHEAETPHMVDAFSTGMGAREQPLLIVISTAGTNLRGPCRERQKVLEDVLNGVIENDLLFGTVYSIDADDDWQDIKVWEKANPNYGVSVSPDFIKSKLIEATNYVSRRNITLCKNLNVWMSADTAWMNILAWNKCADPALSIDDFEGESCWIGLDLASKKDVACMATLFRHDDNYFCFCRHYLPEETIELPENSHYQAWDAEDLLIGTPGPITDYGYIEEDLLDLAKRFDIEAIPYDPHQATQLSTRMIKEGLPMVECRQIVLNMSEPMKELEAIVLDDRFHFDGDPVLSWMASNVVAHLDRKDNIYPAKERVQNKIDGIVALIMALGQAVKGGEEKIKSVYEDRGVIFF